MSDGAPLIGPDSACEPAPPAAEPPDPIQTGLARLENEVTKLRSCFQERLLYDEAKDRAFDVLYTKLRERDNDERFALKKNLLLALLRLHDHAENAETAFDQDSAGRNRVADLRTELLDILYSEDIEPIPTLGVEFDRTRQQALDIVPTTEPAQDNTVERVVRAGFVCGGRVLRPQSVIVRRYRSPREPELRKGS